MSRLGLIVIFVSIVSLIGGSEVLAGDSCPYRSMKEAIAAITAREKEHRWQKIGWRTSAAAAIAEAKASNKPIFVFFVVEQKKSSPKAWIGATCDTGKT